MLVGAALGGTAASASVDLQRTDVPLPAAPDSVALGDLDGQNGADIVIALPSLGSVGVMLNNGDGTFAAMQQYTAGAHCAGLAVDITLGDVTQPTGNRLIPDGKLDAYVACSPYVVRLTGDGAGAFSAPEEFNLGIQQYLGSDTLDMLALMRRPDGNPAPLLVLQHAVGSFGRQLCVSYDLVSTECSQTPVQGPLAVGDFNGTQAGVPPDEVITSEGTDKMGFFGFVNVPPLMWSDSTRSVPGDPAGSPGLESVALGDLDNDGDLDILTGKPVNSLSDRVASMHWFEWGATGLDQVPTPLPSTAGLDAVAIADVDGDGCNDVVGAGDNGRGLVHLGQGAGSFDNGTDLPELGYQNPATSTRVTMAVGNLTGDGRPEVVITDNLAHAVMIYRNASTPAGGACTTVAPPAPGPVIPGPVTGVPADPGPPVAATPPPPKPPTPAVPRTCEAPGTVAFTAGTAGDDVLVGTGARDTLSGRAGDDCLFGLAGDDRTTGGSGDDLLNGASGDDRMNGDAGDDVLTGGSGDDRMNGDAGNDRLNGGNGNDAITPGAGKDKVAANGGNDTISARDGTRDTIDCGAGRDKVTADQRDAVASDCERVSRRR